MKKFLTAFVNVLALAALGFCGGVWVSYAVGVGPERVVVERAPVVPAPENAVSGLDFSILREVYGVVSKNYFSFDTLSGTTASYGLARGFVESLGDRHTTFFDPTEAKRFQELLSGDFEGIGAYVDKADFGVYVQQIIAGSPAKEAGVLQGDVILKANGVELKDLALPVAISKIRGPDGSWVELEILRPGKHGSLTLRVQRRNIVIPSVEAKTIDGNVAYIAVSTFGDKTADEFSAEVAKAYENGAKGLVVDLRDNGGGYLETAVEILSQFVDRGHTVVTVKQTGISDKSYVSSGRAWPAIPTVVLVNGNSASASEITAGALKEYGLAVLVGERTFGKGSVQQPFNLSDGSEIKVTVAHWFTPNGKGIDGKGIDPDVPVSFQSEDFDKKFDRQLDAAKKVLGVYKKDGLDAARAWRPAETGTGSAKPKK